MTLLDQIDNDYKTALKAGDGERVSTLRLIKTAFKNAQIEKRAELSEEELLKVLQKEAKQRRDSIESFKAASRQDLVAKEESELAILEAYLPQQLSDAELQETVSATIQELGASGPADMGKVMGAITARLSGQADGGRIAAVVRELLNK